MNELTSKEQRAVRTTLLFLRERAGGAWAPVAKALHVEEDTIAKYSMRRPHIDAWPARSKDVNVPEPAASKEGARTTRGGPSAARETVADEPCAPAPATSIPALLLHSRRASTRRLP